MSRDVLYTAVARNDLPALLQGLAGGHDPDALTATGVTPLHLACFHGQMDMIKALVAGGAGLDVRDGDQRTPLMTAIDQKQNDAAKFLLDRGAEWRLTCYGRDAADVARDAGNREALREIWRHATPPEIQMEMLFAVREGRLDDAAFLVDELKADLSKPSPAGVCALECARGKGYAMEAFVRVRVGVTVAKSLDGGVVESVSTMKRIVFRSKKF